MAVRSSLTIRSTLGRFAARATPDAAINAPSAQQMKTRNREDAGIAMVKACVAEPYFFFFGFLAGSGLAAGAGSRGIAAASRALIAALSG